MFCTIKNNRGQSLVEMLIALSVVVIALLGILALVNRSLGLNRITAENYTATYLASEGIELMRNFFEKDYLAQTPGSKNFYGWVGVGPGNIAPINSTYILYEIDFDEVVSPVIVSIVGACGFPGTEPTEAAVRKLLSDCTALQYLRFHTSDGTYSYNVPGELTKFKRVIIIDSPTEFTSVPTNLDFRVTSAVGWQSRGGNFVVQIQDHFLPWRIP